VTQSIATLGIRVTQQGIAEAERDLGKLTQTGAKAEQQAARTAKGMEKTALSAKQLQAATRGLPAQFTDIATALGSGQRPLQVLLQQGGQLKDMFGGIGPAIRAMGGYVLGLVNPLTLAAAAIGALGLAWFQAVERAEAFNKALIATGNYVDSSVAQMDALSDSISALGSVTRGQAVEALQATAASGRITAEQFELVATAAARMEAATGQSIETTVKKFEEIARSPVDALLKLNETEHFLTQAQLDRVRALQDEGREQDAASEAARIYADRLNAVATAAEAARPHLAALWAEAKQGASEALAEVQNFAEFLAATAAKTANRPWYQRFGPTGALAFFRDMYSAQPATPVSVPRVAGAVGSNSERVRMEAAREFARIELSNLDRRQRLEREIVEIRRVGIAAGKTEAQISAQITAARARYAESLPRGRTSRTSSGPSDASIQSARDRFNDMVGRFRAELEGPLERVEQNHLRNMRELEQAAKQGKVSHEDLARALEVEAQAYAKASEEVQNRLEAEVASLSGPVAQAQNEHEQALRRIEELHASGAATGAQYNAMLAEEARVYGQAADAARRAADPIGALLDDMRAQIDLIGRTSAEQAVMNELRRQGISLMGDEAQAALAVARAYEQQAMDKQRVIDLMDGFRKAGADAFTDFVTGAKSAKDAFRDFMDSIAEMITRAIAEQWMTKLFGPMGSDGAGTSGGGWLASLLGGLFGGGRAIGGPVSAGHVYQVNERGAPEIYTAGGKQFLLAPRDGRVTPATAAGGGRASQINQTFVVNGTPDRMTRQQMLRMAGSETSRAIRRG